MEAILILMAVLMLILFSLLIRQKLMIEKLVDQQISLSENLASLKNKQEQNDTDVEEAIEKKFDDTANKIFTQWIQNIAGYNPYSHGG